MNDTFERIKQRFSALNERLSGGQKVAVVLMALMIVVSIATLVWFTTRTEMGPLATDLTAQEGGRITAALEKEKVKFEVVDRGRTIMVPADDVYRLRMKLAEMGVGVSVKGAEVLDEPMGFEPAPVIRAKMHRMLEGELGRTIASLDQVQAARVHLAIPKEELFVTEQQVAKASVKLTLLHGTRLDDSQVQGIVNLTASAVAELRPDNVSVIDQKGRILNEAGPEFVQTGHIVKYKRALEKDLEAKAMSLLEAYVGPGKAKVKVTADIDFSSVSKVLRKVDKDGVAPIREQTLEEERSAGGNRAGGAGAAANNPNAAQGVVRVGDASSGTRQKSVVDNAVPTETITTSGGGPVVTRLTVAVLVHQEVPDAEALKDAQEAAKGKEDDAETPMAIPMRKLSQKELIDIKNGVAKAVGLNAARGDELDVQAINLLGPDMSGAVAEQTLAEQYAPWMKWPAVALVAFFIFLALRPLARFITQEPESAELLTDGQLPLDEETLALPGEADLEELDENEPSVIDRIRELAQTHPDVATAIVKFWLRENKEAS